MDPGIRGKLALVTGSSSGMGFAVCEALASEGANLVLFARSPDRLEIAQASLRARFDVDVTSISGDMTNSDDVRRLAQELTGRGGPDILVLNTGRHPGRMRELLEHVDDTEWEIAYQGQLR